MSISVKLNSNLSKLGELYVQKRVKEFYKAAASELPGVILGLIRKGISPVEGVGKFAQYSKSYVDQIEGKVQFRTINGKAVPFKPRLEVKRDSLYGASFNKVAGKGKRLHDSFKKGTNSKISFSQSFGKGLGAGKIKSPVNLQVSGGMLGSIMSSFSEKGTKIEFTSKLAEYHNNIGVGKNKTKRPFLPNRPEQEFSSLVMKKLKDLLTNSFKT